MKLTRSTKIALAIAVFLTFAQLAAGQLVLDDFSTGVYQKTLKSGSDNNFQSGSMVGGSRETSFGVCSPKSCATANPFLQPNSFQIRAKTKTTPNVLIFNTGYKSQAYLGVGYGFSAPMSLNLASSYDRIRMYFDGTDKAVNFNLTVWSNAGALYSQIGCNLVDPGQQTPFSVDFPFADFTPGGGTQGADFSNVSNLQFLFDGAQGTNNGEDWAVTSFQAILIGAPPGDITCTGFGK